MDLKVCLFPFLKSASGGASYGIELAKSLSHENVKVDIIAFDMDPKVRADLSARGVNVINVEHNPSTLEYVGGPLAAYYYYSECIGSIIEKLKFEEKFDVFHSVLAPASLRWSSTASLVVTAWNPLNLIENIKERIVPLAFPKNLLGVPAIMEYEFMDRMAFKRAKFVTCGTSQVLSYVMKLQPAKAVLCYPPILIPAVSISVAAARKFNLYAVDILSVNLVGGTKNNGRVSTGFPACFQHIERSQHVCLKVFSRILQ